VRSRVVLDASAALHLALLLNHSRSVRDGLLHELHHVSLGLESVSRRIVAIAEVGPEVGAGNPADQDEVQGGGVEEPNAPATWRTVSWTSCSPASTSCSGDSSSPTSRSSWYELPLDERRAIVEPRALRGGSRNPHQR
jgi:hypothetical protein